MRLRCCLAPPHSRVGTQQALVRHVQADHGHVRAGMEYTVGSLRILDDIRFGGRVPAIAFLRERSAHHHQSQFACDFRRRSKCRIDVSQWAGRHYRDVAAVFTDHIDDESHTFR